jgi:tetratricopeptide (TPR) repeat protein
MLRTSLTILLVILVAAQLQADQTDGKIPITTTSEKAREDFVKGRDLMERFRTQEGAALLERAVKADSEFALAYLYLAGTRHTTQDALAYLNLAEKYMGKVSEGERLMIEGTEAGRYGDPMRQRLLYRQLCTAYPNDERSHQMLAGHYFVHQEYELALQKYKRAVEINPQFVQPYNEMGYCYRYLGDYDKAEEAFKKYIELIPDEANPYDSYAELLMKMGRFQESIDYYRKALAVNPDFLISYRGIATNLVFLGKHQEALHQLEIALSNVDHAQSSLKQDFYHSMAVVYADEGKNDQAIEELRKGYRMAADQNDVATMAAYLRVIGYVQLHAGYTDQAADNYKKASELIAKSDLSPAIKRNSERVDFYEQAIIASVRGDYEKAYELAGQYRRSASEVGGSVLDRAVHRLFGLVALEAKDYERAIEELEQANLRDPFVKSKLADALAAAGKTDEAREEYEEVAQANLLSNLGYAMVRNHAIQMAAAM